MGGVRSVYIWREMKGWRGRVREREREKGGSYNFRAVGVGGYCYGVYN